MKGPRYFFNLWGRNIRGNFSFWNKLIHDYPRLGWPATLFIGVPLLIVSPFTALLKTAIDYATRKPLPKQNIDRLAKNFDRVIGALTDRDQRALIEDVRTYKPTLFFTSNSTKQLLESLDATYDQYKVQKINKGENAGKHQPVIYHDQHLFELKAYMIDPKNIDKGMFKHIAEKVDKYIPKTLDTEGCEHQTHVVAGI